VELVATDIETFDRRDVVPIDLGGEQDISRDEPAVQQHAGGTGLAGLRPEAHARQTLLRSSSERRAQYFSSRPSLSPTPAALSADFSTAQGRHRPVVDDMSVLVPHHPQMPWTDIPPCPFLAREKFRAIGHLVQIRDVTDGGLGVLEQHDGVFIPVG
jgi:hypothetical protein